MKKLVLYAMLVVALLVTATVSANQVLPVEALNELAVDSPILVTAIETDCLALKVEQSHYGKILIDTNTLSAFQTHRILCNVELRRKYDRATRLIVAVNIGF